MNDQTTTLFTGDIPGAPMASRPIHFIWLLDCSGSMGVNGKIHQLNFAIKEAIPEMQRVADENPAASLLVRVITFASGAVWHLGEPTAARDFTWKDVHTYGGTDMGAGFHLAAKELTTPPMPQRALRPVLALVSDGQPTDDWRSGLQAINNTPWGKRAVRVAIAIGQDADKPMLKQFLDNPEMEPLAADNPKQLVAAIRWASTVAVKNASIARVGNEMTTVNPTLTPQGGDDDLVW
jgi:uncharacterized protein YegL